jgi:hypothetical protein
MKEPRSEHKSALEKGHKTASEKVSPSGPAKGPAKGHATESERGSPAGPAKGHATESERGASSGLLACTREMALAVWLAQGSALQSAMRHQQRQQKCSAVPRQATQHNETLA